MSNKQADENFNWGGNSGEPENFTNKNLQCDECESETDELMSCKQFLDRKPGKVLYGGKCEKFKQKQS